MMIYESTALLWKNDEDKIIPQGPSSRDGR